MGKRGQTALSKPAILIVTFIVGMAIFLVMYFVFKEQLAEVLQSPFI